MARPAITLRNIQDADAGALAHILISSGEEAFRGRVPDQCLTFTEAESAANWRHTLREGMQEGEVFVVAVPPGGAPAGYAWGGPYDADPAYPGELRQIAILPALQGRGIGRCLVSHVASRLAERGIHALRVEVLAINPNRGFYEHLGARLIGEGTVDWDGIEFANCVYAWSDTRLLCEGWPGRDDTITGSMASR
jgi:ribosomal protein S18 acetylase RimI-like enzyme